MPRKNKKRPVYSSYTEKPGCSNLTIVPRTNKKRQVNPTDVDKLQRLFEEASSGSSPGGSSVHDFEESEKSNSPAHDPYSDTAGEYGSDSEYNPAEDEMMESEGSDSTDDNVNSLSKQDDGDSDRTVSDVLVVQLLAGQINSDGQNDGRLAISPIMEQQIETLQIPLPSPNCAQEQQIEPLQILLDSPNDSQEHQIEPSRILLPSPNDAQEQQTEPSRILLPSPNDAQEQQTEPSRILLPSPNDAQEQQTEPSRILLPSPNDAQEQQIEPSRILFPSPNDAQEQLIEPSQILFPSPNDAQVPNVGLFSPSEPGINLNREYHQSRRPVLSPTNDNSAVWEDTTLPILEFEFNMNDSGPQVYLDGNTTPLHVLEFLFTDEIVDYVVSCTNAYGEALCNSNRPHTRGSRIQSFKPTDKAELKKFLGLCLLQGHQDSPSIRKLFTISDPLYYHPLFPFTMSGRRFEQILRCICISDLGAKGMNKVKYFAETIVKKFQRINHPDKELALDESLLLFRGRLSFRQYIKTKKARYGIKFYALTTHDGYILNFIIYEGKATLEEDGGSDSKTEKLVMKLMEPYLNKEHELYMDNFYNSIGLSKKLLRYKTHTTGTLRKDRKENPKALFKKHVRKGEHFWQRKGHVYASIWKDKRLVFMVTTKHHPRLIITRNRYAQLKTKPIEVAEYNKFMSGIDKSDQMMAYYSTPKKTIRWYKKVFFHLLDMMVWNAYYMFKKHCDSNTTLLSFRESIITSYLQVNEGTLNNLQQMRLAKTSSRRRKKEYTNNLPQVARENEAGHWPELIPLPENAKRNKYFLRCRVCTKNKLSKQTSYRCKGCSDKPPLCPGCFESCHKDVFN